MTVVSTTPPALAGGAPPRRLGILSTFPPTPCGIATFSAALTRGLAALGTEVQVVRVGDGTPAQGELVVGDLEAGVRGSPARAAALLSAADVVLVQHEYGLYGGRDGDEVVEVMADLRVPAVVIAHTVLTAPTPHQRSVLTEVAGLAGRVVVMSEAARVRLCQGFDVDPHKVVTIPHGAVVPARRPASGGDGRPTLLTWGLVGPGKGIERVIDAMTSLHTLPSRPRYVVAGRTHPKVLARHGDTYRSARVEQAARLGVSASVVFDAAYRDVPSLTAMVQAAAVVVLPYDSREQATSGVLVDALAAGRPVVATAFPHAEELLAGGAGVVVDHDDPEALVRALRGLLSDPARAEAMAAAARRLAPTLGWPVVAAAHLELAGRLLEERAALV